VKLIDPLKHSVILPVPVCGRREFLPAKDRVESPEQKENFNETRGCARLIAPRAIPILLYPPSPSLFLSVPLIHGDRGRNYYFLTSTKRLILQRSIYRTPRCQPSHVGEWHREWLRFARTVASSTLHTILRR